jgi:hypothetical protein
VRYAKREEKGVFSATADGFVAVGSWKLIYGSCGDDPSLRYRIGDPKMAKPPIIPE